MAAEAVTDVPESQPKGITCPRCGSENHYVYRSVPERGEYVRQRICQDCKNRFNTFETAS